MKVAWLSLLWTASLTFVVTWLFLFVWFVAWPLLVSTLLALVVCAPLWFVGWLGCWAVMWWRKRDP